MLGPGPIGLFELALTPYELLDNVRNFGTGPALIYESTLTRKRADAAWTINMLLAVVAALVLEAIAGPIAAFYGHPRIEPIVRILAVVYLFHAAGSVHSFLLLRDMDFRARAIAPLGQVIIAGCLAVVLVAWGFGIGSLLLREMLSGLLGAALLWAVYPYIPRLALDLTLAGPLLRYSTWVGLGLTTFYLSQNIDVFVGGHIIRRAADIGFYRTAWSLAFLVAGVGTLASGGLVFPALSRLTHDREVFCRSLLLAQRQLALGVLPVAILVAVAAPVLIVPLLGGRWEQFRGSAIVLTLLASYAGVRTLLVTFGEAYKAIGKPWIFPVYNLVKLVILLPAMILGAQFGIVGLAVVYLPLQIVEVPVSLLLAYRVLAISPLEVWRAVHVPVIATVVMAAGTLGVERLLLGAGLGDVAVLLACLLIAPLVYLPALLIGDRTLLLESWHVLFHGL